MSGLMTLMAVVKSCVGDLGAIGRYPGLAIGALAMGQWFDGAARDGDFIHLGIERVVLEIGTEVSGDEQ